MDLDELLASCSDFTGFDAKSMENFDPDDLLDSLDSSTCSSRGTSSSSNSPANLDDLSFTNRATSAYQNLPTPPYSPPILIGRNAKVSSPELPSKVFEVEETPYSYSPPPSPVSSEPDDSVAPLRFVNRRTFTVQQQQRVVPTAKSVIKLQNSKKDEKQQIVTEVTIDDQVYAKPDLPFTCLTALAMKNSHKEQLLVTEIYSFIRRHFPYYKTEPKDWRNSVRHNLSHSSTFEKIESSCPAGLPNKRASLWRIAPAAVAKMDEKLREKTSEHSANLRRAMSRPEDLDRLVRGELKLGSCLKEVEYEFTSEFLALPGVKRRRNVARVYPPAKRANRIVCVTLED